ncbi:phosphoadenylyl-sulfate reductase [Chelatococcus reniformis]|uniref:Adenosine 5'-phosphosulfate reductase n=1 Tax=Chelatococcus reniformis TaxID=1494448 RepID=A0A916XC42_9HYPH|nr:phosphoadenylyl-sulfate reductase [Chelatococcus reniformis]GGC63013.1 phosphoadenosine phosphosulfate reductase [Chelatococcus reniformis]
MAMALTVGGTGPEAPAADPAARARALDVRYAHRPPHDILRLALDEQVAGRVALVSSFGAESAVLLHMAAEVDADVPVIFVDTGRLFPETLAYKDRLVAEFGLSDVRIVGPEAAVAEVRDPLGAMFALDADGCCGFRKVEPLAAALRPFDAWISGRKRYQASTREDIPTFEASDAHVKINPLASWSMADVAAYLREHRLPPHPLVAAGYPSIGCAPCTTQVAAGEDARAGRWRGKDKTECGIHLPRHQTVGGAL